MAGQASECLCSPLLPRGQRQRALHFVISGAGAGCSVIELLNHIFTPSSLSCLPQSGVCYESVRIVNAVASESPDMRRRRLDSLYVLELVSVEFYIEVNFVNYSMITREVSHTYTSRLLSCTRASQSTILAYAHAQTTHTGRQLKLRQASTSRDRHKQTGKGKYKQRQAQMILKITTVNGVKDMHVISFKLKLLC